MVTGLDRYPLGYEMDLGETASMLGLAYGIGTSNSFTKALQRCVLFGVSQQVPGGLAVRRKVPPVAGRHLARMPDSLRAMHYQWQTREFSLTELQRGRTLAEVMMSAGEDPEVVERHLLAVGVSPAAAAEAIALTLSPTV